MENDVRAWLESLGLGKYAEVFAENNVDDRALPLLDREDLKELGISLGHRKIMLAAIAEMNRAEEPVEAPPPADDDQPIATAGQEAERRQLTVMFVDLVGSTALSRRMDPEDLRDVMRRYQNALAGCIARYDGYLAKFLGDGVLAYFGWPEAHEDQTERAVRAGIDAAQAVGEIALTSGERLQARVGIATGQVVVGDLIGDTTADVQAVTGDTPNLAARLQNLAAPGQVVIDAASHRLVGSSFETSAMGKHELRGFGEPVDAWAVISDRVTDSRFEAWHGEDLSRLIGRTHELGIMRERGDLAKAGEGQLLLLSGEAGIGKSRLIHALCDGEPSQTQFRLRYQCSPYHTDTALFPIIQRLELAAGFHVKNSIPTKLDKLEDLLRRISGDIGASAPLIATLLSLPVEERYGAMDLTAPQRRDQVIETLIAQVINLSERRPVLLVFEDVHWIDSTTELLIGELLTRISERKVFVVMSHRPDYSPPWHNFPHVTSVTLSRLGRKQGVEIARAISGGDLSDETIGRIITRADGVPLFIEELTKSMVEADQDIIPESLRASMTARLDRLGDAKQMAQIGAVIGREFDHQLAVSLSGLETEQANDALHQLVVSGLVLQQGTAPDALYQFKHALVQDSAYSSLLRSRRRKLHADFAASLMNFDPSATEFEPEVLAYHWEHGGDLEQAARYRIMAAERADRLSASWEAVAHYMRAIVLNEQSTDSADNRRRFLDTILALIGLRGGFWRTDEEEKQGTDWINRALKIARKLDDLPSIARLEAYTSWFSKDQELLATAISHAEASGDEAVRAEVEQAASAYLGFLGRFEESLTRIGKAIEIYDRLGDDANLGFALAGEGRCFSARAGRLKHSLMLADRARQLAATSDSLGFKAWLAMETEPYMYLGDWERVIEIAEQDVPVALECGDWFVVMYASSWTSLAYLKVDRVSDARKIIDEAFACQEDAFFDSPAMTYLQIASSSVLLREGRVAEARISAEGACAVSEAQSLQLELGASLRSLGEIEATAGNAAAANACFQRSLQVFGTIQSQPELAQTLVAFGRFKQKSDATDGTQLLNRALTLFEKIGAEGWAEETATLLQ